MLLSNLLRQLPSITARSPDDFKVILLVSLDGCLNFEKNWIEK
jgi:hypothetical protein